MPAADALRISAANIGLYSDFHAELVAHLEQLIEMTRKYPVEIEFKGLRFVFETEADIRAAITLIEQELQRAKRA